MLVAAKINVMRRFAAAALLVCVAVAPAGAAEPIKIGFGMALTGGLAANGKSALIAMQIWKDDVNAKGGLLGRPVELVFYDDQSNPSTIPGIYTKLLDVDKADLIVSGYGTNVIAPAMPVVIQHNATFLALFGLAVNSEFHYPKYFTMLPDRARRRPASPRLLRGRRCPATPSRRPSRSSPPMPNIPHNASEGVRKTPRPSG